MEKLKKIFEILGRNTSHIITTLVLTILGNFINIWLGIVFPLIFAILCEYSNFKINKKWNYMIHIYDLIGIIIGFLLVILL